MNDLNILGHHISPVTLAFLLGAVVMGCYVTLLFLNASIEFEEAGE